MKAQRTLPVVAVILLAIGLNGAGGGSRRPVSAALGNGNIRAQRHTRGPA